jgi:hypothetical protein
MKFKSTRTNEEVDALALRLEDVEMQGSKYPGQSYEEGALAMLGFLEGLASADDIYEP